jgi:hypothetical protein
MKLLLVGALLTGACLVATAQITPVVNVNSRYIVASIEVAGSDEFNLSPAIHAQIQSLIGENLDQSALDGLTDQIRKELHAKTVTYRIMRGDQPDQVKVNLEVTRRSVSLEVNVPKFSYHSTQGWTGVVEGITGYGPGAVTFRLLSDNDELVERNTGILARYEHKKVAGDRVRLAFQFESYHPKWSRNTQEAEDPEELYRNRQNFEPSITLVIAKPLTLTAGVSFERFQTQFPAARIESANAVVNTLRYHRTLEDSYIQKQVLDAGYSLRAATNLLGSDFAYARHRWNLAYTFTRGRNTLLVTFVGGFIAGRAPLFERYVLGNSSTLRGWNRYDIDPTGGSRVAHGSVEYRYRYFQVFYDAGAVWDRKQDPAPRNSVGVGLRKDGFSLAVAFPLKDGRVDPVFIAGMNF